MPTSLLETGQLNMTLPDPDPVAPTTDGKAVARNPDFTAARFFSEQPQRYLEIVRLRAEGMSGKAVARMLQCSRNLVAAIDKRESGTATVEHLKREASNRYRHIARLCSESLEEMLLDDDQTFEPRDLAILIGVLEDKAQLLSGGATSRVEVGDGRPGHEDVAAFFNELRRQHQERMGLGGENPRTGAPAGSEPRSIDAEVTVIPLDQGAAQQDVPGAGQADPGAPGDEGKDG